MERLKSLESWTHCTANSANTSLKVPVCGLGKSKPLSYDKAKENAEKQISNSPYYGFVFQEESEYLGIDVDVDPTGEKDNATKEIPERILSFIKDHPTHVHYSPSGYGLHMMYKLSKKDILLLKQLNLYQGATKNGDGFKGDWRHRKSFLVFTENEFISSTDRISYLSFDDLLKLIPSLEHAKSVESPILQEITKIPSIKEIKEVLEVIPSSFNSKAKRACKSLPGIQPNNNYEYWFTIGSACAHLAILLETAGKSKHADKILEEFYVWSAKDEDGFVSREDVEEKFMLLKASTRKKIADKTATTTYGTLATIAKNCIINFPDMAKSKTGKLRPNPISLKNIDYLVEHDELNLVYDYMGGGICFKGPEKLVKKWFSNNDENTEFYGAIRFPGHSQIVSKRSMSTRFKYYMQDRYGFTTTSQHANEAVEHLTQNMQTVNAFRAWIESRPWDGILRFDNVCRSIIVEHDFDDIVGREQYEQVYQLYIKKSLLSVVGIHFWPQDRGKIPAILVLTGPEHTYKTSWAEWLIPLDMSNYFANANTETITSGGTEWDRFLCTKAIIVVNECEPLFTPRNEQKLKASVDQESVAFRELYTSEIVKKPRTALIIGTTNKLNLFTGSLGTRKIWQIPVKECDSYLIRDLDHQQLYAEIYYRLQEYKKKHPRRLIQTAWAQSEKERAITNRMNIERKKDDVGIPALLREQFGSPLTREFTPQDFSGARGFVYRVGKPYDVVNQPNVWTPTALAKYLIAEYPDIERITRDRVKYALEEFSAIYTGTVNRPARPFERYVSLNTSNKKVTRGNVVINDRTNYYLMPTPLKTEDKE